MRSVLAFLALFVLCTVFAGCGDSSIDGASAERRDPPAEKRAAPGSGDTEGAAGMAASGQEDE